MRIIDGNLKGKTANPDIINKAIREGGYKFISPLLISSDTSSQNQALDPLRNAIYQGTYDLLNDPQVRTVSVYYKDLTSGGWLGIRENEIFDSASLLKVPILIAYLKKSELDPLYLSKKLFYRGEARDGKNIEFYNLKPGTEYTIKDLIDAMIIKSDNSAKDLLFTSLDPTFRNKVFQDLQIPIPNLNEQYKISPRIYSLFFRLLYNSTYLTNDDSEKALELLSRSDYRDGLIAGVPPTLSIAHKFGQYGTPAAKSDDIAEWQLHDCGIIYYPKHPYLLCVMTRGQDLNKLGEVIKTISQITYEAAEKDLQ